MSPSKAIPSAPRLTEQTDLPFLHAKIPQNFPALSCWPARPTAARTAREVANGSIAAAILAAAKKQHGKVVTVEGEQQQQRLENSAGHDDHDDGGDDGKKNKNGEKQKRTGNVDDDDDDAALSPLTLTCSKPGGAMQLEKELSLKLRSRKSLPERVGVVNDLLRKLAKLFPSYQTVIHAATEVIAGFSEELTASVRGVESSAVATVKEFQHKEMRAVHERLREECEARILVEAELRAVKGVLAKRVQERDDEVQAVHKETMKMVHRAQEEVQLDEEVRRLRLHVGALASENAKLKIQLHKYERELAIDVGVDVSISNSTDDVGGGSGGGGGGMRRPYKREINEQVQMKFIEATTHELDRCRLVMQREMVEAASGKHSAFRLKVAHMQAEIDQLTEKLREAERLKTDVEHQSYERRFIRSTLPAPVFEAIKRDGLASKDDDLEAIQQVPARKAEFDTIGRCYTPRPLIPFDVQTKLGISLGDRTRDIVESLAVVAVDLHEELAELRHAGRKLHAAARWMATNEIDTIFDEEVERAEEEQNSSLTASPHSIGLSASTNTGTNSSSHAGNNRRFRVGAVSVSAGGIIPTCQEKEWPHVPHFLRTDITIGILNRSWGAKETVNFSIQVLNMIPLFMEEAKRLKDKFTVTPQPDTLQDRRRSALLPPLDATTAQMVAGTTPVPIGYVITVVLRHLAEELLLRQMHSDCGGDSASYDQSQSPKQMSSSSRKRETPLMNGTLADALLRIGIGGISSAIGPNQQLHQRQQLLAGRSLSRSAVSRVATNLAYNWWDALSSFQQSEPVCRAVLRIVDGSLPLGIFGIFRRFVSSLHDEVLLHATGGAGLVTWPLFAKCLAWRFSGAPLPSMARQAVFQAAKTVDWLGMTFADRLPVSKMLSIGVLKLGESSSSADGDDYNGNSRSLDHSRSTGISPLSKALLHLTLDAIQELFNITYQKLEPALRQSTFQEGVSVLNVGEALALAKEIDLGFIAARENDFARSSYIAREVRPATTTSAASAAAAAASFNSSYGDEEVPDTVDVSTALSFSAFWLVRDALVGAPKLDDAIHRPTGGSKTADDLLKPSSVGRRKRNNQRRRSSVAAGGGFKRSTSEGTLDNTASGDLSASFNGMSERSRSKSSAALAASGTTNAFLNEMLEGDLLTSARIAAVGELEQSAWVEWHDFVARLRRVTPQLLRSESLEHSL